MIAELQDPVFMRQKVSFLRALADDMRSTLANFGDLEFSDEPSASLDDVDVGEVVGSLHALEADEALYRDGEYWMPHNAYAALLQSNLDVYYRVNDSVAEDDQSRFGEYLRADPLTSASLIAGLPLASLKQMFRINRLDPRWVLVLQAKVVKWRKGRPAFPDNSANTTALASNARVVLLGDWASGIPEAVTLARTVWKDCLQPVLGTRELHVVHLGDAYYAGMPSDYKRRFRNQWPVPLSFANQISSWTLAGNHDMYSGGHGYFDLLKDPRFAAQRHSSYFLLENQDWQMFGLDTSFDPRDLKGNIGELYGEQAAWVARKRDAAAGKKCVLLSHHQPFCAYSVIEENLERRLRPIQDANQIDAWFWGHEHLCAVFDAHNNIRFPVLLGHGGFPQRVKPKLPGAPPMQFEWLHTWPTSSPQADLMLGFAVLDFDGPRIDVALLDLFGKMRHAFTVT